MVTLSLSLLLFKRSSTAMDNEMQESYDASMYEGPQTENETQGSYDATMYESFQVDGNKND